MQTKILLPNALNDIAAMKYVAVFLNGMLLCPSQPYDQGDYQFEGTGKQLFGTTATKRIRFHVRVEPLDLIQVTDFKSFRWTFTNGCWSEL